MSKNNERASLWSVWESTASANGISRVTFDQRVRRGSTPEDAATKKKRPYSPFSPEEKELIKKNGLNGNVVNGRINTGWSKHDALNTPRLSKEERAERSSAGLKEYWNDESEKKIRSDARRARIIDNVDIPALTAKLRSDNTSGVKGVSYSKTQNHWIATIKVKSESVYLGAFAHKEDAIAARKAGEEKYHKPYLGK